MKLLVGLGNPGANYAQTRHNVGYMVIERLARTLGAGGKSDSKLASVVAEARLDGAKVILAQPTTFMNLSGEAVSKLLHWYKLTPADLVIIYDDFALPLGAIRVRPDGRAAGHNGISSIIAHVGTQTFARVRVGIGPLPAGFKSPDFVLGRFNADEREKVQEAIGRAIEATECVMRHGVERAMQDYNGPRSTL